MTFLAEPVGDVANDIDAILLLAGRAVDIGGGDPWLMCQAIAIHLLEDQRGKLVERRRPAGRH